MSARRLVTTALIALAIVTHACPPAARAVTETDEARVLRYKAIQRDRLMRGVHARAERYQSRIRTVGDPTATGFRRRVPRDLTEAGGPQGVEASRLETSAEPAKTSTYPNIIMNNRATDTATCPTAPCTGLPWSGQCEVSIAAFGNNVLAAWNDGEGFQTGTSTQGFGWSTDGGVTWTDGGVPPTTNVGTWSSDPVVVVNEKTGEFYYSALCEPTFTTNGIGVVKGTFGVGTFSWGTPEVAISASNSSVIYDKQWLAADSTTGNLYVVYARFTVSGGFITTNRIDFQRKLPANPWSAPTTLSALADAGLVQGARVAVGPTGDVWAVWNAIDPFAAPDFMRVRRSTTQGSSWLPEVSAVSEYTNFGSGAPGFNRGAGFAFPAIAVDRTSGPHRGRVYLAWNESIDYYNDPLGTGSTVAETEPNNTPGTATAFTLSQVLTGTINSTSDLDYWSFTGTQGQTIICEFNGSAAPSLDPAFRLFCGDGTSRLAFTEPGPGGRGIIVFTLPASGTYYLRVAPFVGTGSYTIRTALNGPVAERARDHRDVFVNYSDDGATWSTPTRANDDPGWFDNWLPEVAVADVGRPFVAWYDWRDAPPATCGAVSQVYLARSGDGGISWSANEIITDAPTAWTTTYSNIAPNQGDYIALFGNPLALRVAWADGRNGDPDVFTTTIPLVVTPVAVSLVSAHAEPDLVRLVWQLPDGPTVTATVERRGGAGDWLDLARVTPDGTGRVEFEDHDVIAGARYDYRLRLPDGTAAGEIVVDVPSRIAAALAIHGVRPNPSDREMWVSYALAGGEPATLELLEISGRRVRDQALAGGSAGTVDLTMGRRLPPGIYVVRLTQAGRSVSKRVSVVR